jgi:hypothetical protein
LIHEDDTDRSPRKIKEKIAKKIPADSASRDLHMVVIGGFEPPTSAL